MARDNTPKLGDTVKVLGTVLGCAVEDIAPDVIVTPFIPLKQFKRHVTGEVRELAPPFFFKGFTGSYEGSRVTVILTGVGPSRVGDCLGFLSLAGARRVLFAGAVGGLSKKISIGDLFIPTSAGDGEGFARYVSNPFARIVNGAQTYAGDKDEGAHLDRFLSGRGHSSTSGAVFTIGAIAFESDENLKIVRDAGYDGLEMELSSFFAACNHYGFAPAALTYVSDLPLESSLWEKKTPEESERLKLAYRALPELCLAYLAENK